MVAVRIESLSDSIRLMPTRLVPCESCHRHVRALEEACPHCGALTAPTVTQPSAAPVANRLGSVRSALFAGAVLIGPLVAASGCGRAMYGGPPPDLEPATSEGTESTESTGEETEAPPGDEAETPAEPDPANDRPLYGAPPVEPG